MVKIPFNIGNIRKYGKFRGTRINDTLARIMNFEGNVTILKEITISFIYFSLSKYSLRQTIFWTHVLNIYKYIYI